MMDMPNRFDAALGTVFDITQDYHLDSPKNFYMSEIHIARCPNSITNGIQDYAIILMALFTGCRESCPDSIEMTLPSNDRSISE